MKAILLALAATVVAFAQGPLTPPGAPAATMKTLDQIEPRTPISQADVAGFGFTISQPGSYYLAGHIVFSSPGGFGNAISISARDVTLDLNGFTLRVTGDNAGISIMPNLTNITIRNGSVMGPGTWQVTGNSWQSAFTGSGRPGVFTGGRSSGTETTSQVIVSDLIVSGFSTGVILRGFEESDGNRNTLRRVRIYGCGTGASALYTLISEVAINRCASNALEAEYSQADGLNIDRINAKGIVGSFNQLTRVTLRTLGNNAIDGDHLVLRDIQISGAAVGIIGNHLTLDHAYVSFSRGHGIIGTNNNISNVRAHSNAASGIWCTDGLVSHCLATANGDQGIRGVGSLITACRASGNDTNGTTASGIYWLNGRVVDCLTDTAFPAIP